MVAESVSSKRYLNLGPQLAKPSKDIAANNANEKPNNDSSTTETTEQNLNRLFQPDLKNKEQPRKKLLNIEQATTNVAERNIASARNVLLATATILGISTSSFALFTRMFSKTPDRKDSFAKAAEKFAKTSTAVAYSIFAFINSLRAWKAKDLGLVVSNIIEIPISMLSSSDCLTLNRGLSIGLGNVVMEAQKMFSKTEYKDFGEGINCLTKSLQKVYENFKKNPLSTITNMRSGSGAVIFSALTALAPFVKRITGSNFLAYNMRHWPGIIMEFGKISTINLQRGSYNYWTCGVMMFLSSAINLLGSMSPITKAPSEILTWIPNVLGRRLLAASIINRETTRKHATGVTAGQAFKLAAREVLHMNKAFAV